MDDEDRLLPALEARELAEWRARKAEKQRLEAAAREAHKARRLAALVNDRTIPAWEDLALSSQEQLIADAAAVAANPEITAEELHRLYQQRLEAWGDTDNPDIGTALPLAEEAVLLRLKEVLAHARGNP